jgi:glycine betaine/proline transport system ATP-binding protein
VSAEITLQSVSKIFSSGTTAVREVSLTIQTGEIFVVMGLSGSGKSTLLRMINGLIRPSSGAVVVQEKSLLQLSARELQQLRRSSMAMVFQSFALLPNRTVLDNAAFGLEVAGIPRRERDARARLALERVGLGDQLQRWPQQLSGGMQQRVGLARALALDPPILLMDEAFSALDPLIRTDMQTLLLELQAEQRRTIVFISHDLDEAIRLGDRIALMKDGQLLQCGTAQELLQHPANDQVRQFFQDVDAAAVLPVELIAEAAPQSETLNYLVDEQRRFRGLSTAEGAWIPAAEVPHLLAGTLIREAIDRVAGNPFPTPVLDQQHHLIGVISPQRLLHSLGEGCPC